MRRSIQRAGHPGDNAMVIMNLDGVFFVVGNIRGYDTYIDKLSKYNAKWSD